MQHALADNGIPEHRRHRCCESMYQDPGSVQYLCSCSTRSRHVCCQWQHKAVCLHGMRPLLHVATNLLQAWELWLFAVDSLRVKHLLTIPWCLRWHSHASSSLTLLTFESITSWLPLSCILPHKAAYDVSTLFMLPGERTGEGGADDEGAVGGAAGVRPVKAKPA